MQPEANALVTATAAEPAAQQRLRPSQQQYQAGAVRYLTPKVQTTYQNGLLGRVRAQPTSFSETATLFKAPGGGGWNPKSVGQAYKLRLPVQAITNLETARWD